MTLGLKCLRCVLSEKFQLDAKFYHKIINKCDWTNLTRKNTNTSVYAKIDKFPSVDFFPKLHPSYLCLRLRVLLYQV